MVRPLHRGERLAVFVQQNHLLRRGDVLQNRLRLLLLYLFAGERLGPLELRYSHQGELAIVPQPVAILLDALPEVLLFCLAG